MGQDDEAVVRAVCEGWQRKKDIGAFESTGWYKSIHSFKGSGAPHTGEASDCEETVVSFVCVCGNRAESERVPAGALRYRSQIRGILKELRYEDDVSALSTEERAYLEGLMDEEHNVRISKGEILDGEVIITEGPLKGYESNIIRIDRHKRRAILNVRMNNQDLQVDVSLEIVKKIESQK